MGVFFFGAMEKKEKKKAWGPQPAPNGPNGEKNEYKDFSKNNVLFVSTFQNKNPTPKTFHAVFLIVGSVGAIGKRIVKGAFLKIKLSKWNLPIAQMAFFFFVTIFFLDC